MLTKGPTGKIARRSFFVSTWFPSAGFDRSCVLGYRLLRRSWARRPQLLDVWDPRVGWVRHYVRPFRAVA